MLSGKFAKICGHFVRYPEDIVFFPVYVLFGYFHFFIKLYALFTLSEVSDNPATLLVFRPTLSTMRCPSKTLISGCRPHGAAEKAQISTITSD
jgi:hypothetical protein